MRIKNRNLYKSTATDRYYRANQDDSAYMFCLDTKSFVYVAATIERKQLILIGNNFKEKK